MDSSDTAAPTSAPKMVEHPSQSDDQQHLVQPRVGPQPIIEYYYESHQAAGYAQPQRNCFVFSTPSPPFVLPGVGGLKHDNCFHYQLVNNEQYLCLVPRNVPYLQNVSLGQTLYGGRRAAKCWPERRRFNALYSGEGDSLRRPLRPPKPGSQRPPNQMHPVQLLHQIFRKEAFVMEYERTNGDPCNQVRVTYKVNGQTYQAEATRLKEARRLCAKLVLRDQFPQLQIEPDSDMPQPQYDAAAFRHRHPVQILYQIFRHEPIGIHCEEEGAAHFAEHQFTFVVRGSKYQARAETIKEAKRRAAILALNDQLKKE